MQNSTYNFPLTSAVLSISQAQPSTTKMPTSKRIQAPIEGSRRSSRLEEKNNLSASSVQDKPVKPSIQAKRVANDTYSRLLLLPPEIRALIADLLLVVPGEFPVTKETAIDTTTILRVCSRLRYEFMPIFFTNNLFTMWTGHSDSENDGAKQKQLKTFLKWAPTDMLSKIHTIHFHPTRIVYGRNYETIRVRANQASQIEQLVFGQLRTPPVVWVAMVEGRTQMAGFVNRLCIGGMKKKDGSVMTFKERLAEWNSSFGRG